MSMKHAGFYSVPEAATILGITIQTLRYWIKTGKINGHQHFEQGKVQIPISEVNRLQANFNKPMGGGNAE